MKFKASKASTLIQPTTHGALSMASYDIKWMQHMYTMWCPQIAASWFITPISLWFKTRYTYIYLQLNLLGSTNHETNWGGGHIVVYRLSYFRTWGPTCQEHLQTLTASQKALDQCVLARLFAKDCMKGKKNTGKTI